MRAQTACKTQRVTRQHGPRSHILATAAATAWIKHHLDSVDPQPNPKSPLGHAADLAVTQQGQLGKQEQGTRASCNGPVKNVAVGPSGNLNASITGRVKACKTWQEAFKVFCQYSDTFNSINTSALIHHTSKLLTAHSASGRTMSDVERQDLNIALQELHDFAEAELHRLGPRELANTAYGLSKMGILSRRFAQLMLGRADPSQFNNQELANVLWSLANAGHRPADGQWLHAVMQQLAARMHGMKSQELANSSWALARMRVRPGAAVLQALIDESTRRAAYLQPADLSNILQALAVWRYESPDPQALAPLYVACADQACLMSPHISSTIMWAVSVAGWQLPSAWLSYMCQALAPHLPHRTHAAAQLAACEHEAPQEQLTHNSMCTSDIRVSNNMHTSQGCQQEGSGQGGAAPCQQHEQVLYLPSASVSLEQDVLMQRQDGSQWEAPPCDVTERNKQWVSTRDAALALYALARRRYRPRLELLQALVDVVLDRAWSCPPQDLVMCVWAATKLGYHVPDDQLCTALAASTVRIDQYQPRQLAWLVGAVAHRRCAAVPSTWLKAVCRHMIKRSALWQPQDVSHTLWGLSRLGQHLSGRMLRVLLFTLLHPGEDEVPVALGRGIHRKLAALDMQLSPDSSNCAGRSSTAFTDSGTPTAAAHVNGAEASTRRESSSVALPTGLRHQHLANAIWAIPNLLPPEKRQQFEYLNHDLLMQVEQLSLQLLAGGEDSHKECQATAMSSRGDASVLSSTDISMVSNRLKKDVPFGTVAWHSSSAAAAGACDSSPMQAGQQQQQQQQATRSQQHGWARCELLQMASGFAALGHRPSRRWMAAHCRQVKKHWEQLPPRHQQHLLCCYQAIGDAPTLAHFKDELTLAKFEHELRQATAAVNRHRRSEQQQHGVSMAPDRELATKGYGVAQQRSMPLHHVGVSRPGSVSSTIVPFKRTQVHDPLHDPLATTITEVGTGGHN